jgi:hypothetical protein
MVNPGTMKPPTLINLRTRQPYDVYIGLGSVWGNVYSSYHSRKRAIRLYEEDWRKRLISPATRQLALANLAYLDSMVMGCHCAPKLCHGDVLIKLFEEFINGKMELNDQRGES